MSLSAFSSGILGYLFQFDPRSESHDIYTITNNGDRFLFSAIGVKQQNEVQLMQIDVIPDEEFVKQLLDEYRDQDTTLPGLFKRTRTDFSFTIGDQDFSATVISDQEKSGVFSAYVTSNTGQQPLRLAGARKDCNPWEIVAIAAILSFTGLSFYIVHKCAATNLKVKIFKSSGELRVHKTDQRTV
jgi:hypothetical protein